MSTHKIQFTVQDIYELHTQLENAFVLSSGVRDENLLASSRQYALPNPLWEMIYTHPSTIKQHNYVTASQQSSFYRWKQTNSIA